MRPFNCHEGLVMPLDRANIDMDQIISKQYLKRIERKGYASGLFYNWRYTYENKPRENFVMNNPKYEDASILLVGENFGCGSSWEHAVWALLDSGFKVVIAPSIADYFYLNSLNMGLLPHCLEKEDVDQLFTWAEQDELNLAVDLEQQTVKNKDKGWSKSFEIDSFNKETMLQGIRERDQIDTTMNYLAEIGAYEDQDLLLGR